jgi:hypothetical protein
MCAEPPVFYVVFAPPIFVPKLKVGFLDDRNRSSGAPIIHWSVMCPTSPLGLIPSRGCPRLLATVGC